MGPRTCKRPLLMSVVTAAAMLLWPIHRSTAQVEKDRAHALAPPR
jgi:hypothetical protein